MKSRCIYEVFRPSDKTYASLRTYAWAWDEVEVVGAVAPGRGSGIVHRLAGGAKRAAP
jgi:hypothetical protein